MNRRLFEKIYGIIGFALLVLPIMLLGKTHNCNSDDCYHIFKPEQSDLVVNESRCKNI